jgi:hypothetical protein
MVKGGRSRRGNLLQSGFLDVFFLHQELRFSLGCVHLLFRPQDIVAATSADVDAVATTSYTLAVVALGPDLRQIVASSSWRSFRKTVLDIYVYINNEVKLVAIA